MTRIIQGFREDPEDDIVETLQTLSAAMRYSGVEVKIYPELLEDVAEEIAELRMKAHLLELEINKDEIFPY